MSRIETLKSIIQNRGQVTTQKSGPKLEEEVEQKEAQNKSNEITERNQKTISEENTEKNFGEISKPLAIVEVSFMGKKNFQIESNPLGVTEKNALSLKSFREEMLEITNDLRRGKLDPHEAHMLLAAMKLRLDASKLDLEIKKYSDIPYRGEEL